MQGTIYILAIAGFGFWGHNIGKKKGRGTAGAWLGALLGLIGIIIVSCMKPVQDHFVRQPFYPTTPQQPADGWYTDPTGRHQLRYYDGTWSTHVSDNGVASTDTNQAPVGS